MSSLNRVSLSAAIVALGLSSSAQAAKVIVFAPTAGTGLSKNEAVVVGDAVAAATSRAGHDVVTQQQLEAVVGLESMKQLAGCEAGSCASELGDALGAEAILNVSIGSVGQSVIVTLKRTDTKGGANKVGDRRFKKGKDAIDGILDALPALVGEVLGNVKTTTATATTTATTATTTAGTLPILAADKVPEARIDEVIAAPKGLTYLTDRKGRVLAFSTKDPTSTPMFAGTATALYAVHDGGSSGSDGEGGFSRTFWDPRIGGGGAQRMFERRKGVYELTCGASTTTFTELKTAPKPKFHAAPWRRQALMIARDDTLRYVVVDADRAAEPIADRRIWIGKKGKLVPLDLEIDTDTAWGQDGLIAVGDGITIKLSSSGGVLIEGAGPGAVQTQLTGLDLWDNAAMLYNDVRPWGDVQLGTPCDGLLPGKR